MTTALIYICVVLAFVAGGAGGFALCCWTALRSDEFRNFLINLRKIE